MEAQDLLTGPFPEKLPEEMNLDGELDALWATTQLLVTICRDLSRRVDWLERR